MYAECPHCHAIFRVTEEILSKAGGKVRCGECSHVFNVNETNGHDINTPAAGNDDADNEVTIARHQPEVEPAVPAQPLPNGLPSSFTPEDNLDESIEKPEEDFELIIEERDDSEVQVNGGEGLRIVWSIVAVLLALLLLSQILVAYRNTIVNTVPALRPVLSGLCAVSGCVIDPRRDVKKIVLLQHSIFSHPASDGALMIRGEMVNKADFEQPYPVVELKLSNIQGKPVALRRFGPDEYLDSSSPLPALMPTGQDTPIHLEVLDPGKNALAFEFDFL